MSNYVRRVNPTTGAEGWTGPIRSDRQAAREAAAWQAEGWGAEVQPSTPEVRAAVRSWERERRRARG